MPPTEPAHVHDFVNVIRDGMVVDNACRCGTRPIDLFDEMTVAPTAPRFRFQPETYDARRREVAAMIEEADRQGDTLAGSDALADALMEIAEGWMRSVPPTDSTAALRTALDENALFAYWPDEDTHYEYEDGPEREPVLFVRWDHMWARIRAALASLADDPSDTIDVFELDDATGWRAINQTTGALADAATPEEARIAVMRDEDGPVGFAPDHFTRMQADDPSGPDVEAAWEGLREDLSNVSDETGDPIGDAIARHRPIIEAAIRAESVRGR